MPDIFCCEINELMADIYFGTSLLFHLKNIFERILILCRKERQSLMDRKVQKKSQAFIYPDRYRILAWGCSQKSWDSWRGFTIFHLSRYWNALIQPIRTNRAAIYRLQNFKKKGAMTPNYHKHLKGHTINCPAISSPSIAEKVVLSKLF